MSTLITNNLDGLRTLTSAIHSGNNEVLGQYLQNGEDPNADYGMTLLAHAANAGNVFMVKLLLDAKANVDFGGKSGKFPLYVAAKSQHPHNIDILQLLIEHGANLNMKYINGNTALLESVSANDVIKTSILLAAGANLCDTNNGGDSVLHISALKGYIEMTEMLIKAGMSASVVKYTGRNVAQQTGTQPLHMTTFGLQGGFAEVARVLLEAGADVNAAELNGRTTLHHAAIRNAYKVLDVLLEFGCDLDPISMENGERKTPLLKAIDGRHASMVGRLVSAGCRLDVADCWGTPPLLAAVFSGDPATVSLLVQSGCDVDESSPKNPSVNPLYESLSRALSITVMLVTAGCDVQRAVGRLSTTTQRKGTMYADRMSWLLDVAAQPLSLQMIARRLIRKQLGYFRYRYRVSEDGIEVERVADKLEMLHEYGAPKRICEYLKCSELCDVMMTYEPSVPL